jgi:hypothetical protein
MDPLISRSAGGLLAQAGSPPASIARRLKPLTLHCESLRVLEQQDLSVRAAALNTGVNVCATIGNPPATTDAAAMAPTAGCCV